MTAISMRGVKEFAKKFGRHVQRFLFCLFFVVLVGFCFVLFLFGSFCFLVVVFFAKTRRMHGWPTELTNMTTYIDPCTTHFDQKQNERLDSSEKFCRVHSDQIGK